MKSAALIVTACALLAACAPLRPPAGVTALQQAAAAGAPAAGTRAAGTPAAGTPAADTALTADLMYELVAADFELRNGNWRAAYDQLLAAARRTRDARLAQRALEAAMIGEAAPEALAAVGLWREIAPDSDEALQYFLGLVVLDGRFDQARPLLAERLARAPAAQRGLAMLQIQRFLTRAGDKAGALALLDSLVAPYHDTLEARLVLAQGAHAAGDHARAVREAKAARALAPDSELALLTLAQVTPDPAEALQIAAAFLDGHADAHEVRGAYARMLIDRKQFEDAKRQFALLLQAQPDNLLALYALGVLNMETGDAAAAERHLQAYVAALDALPGDARDPSHALAALVELAQARRDDAQARAWLARLETASGRGAAYLAAYLKRAQLVARQGDLKTARALLHAYQADAPADQARLVQAEAQILREARHSAQAYAVLAAGAQRFGDDPELLYEYAIAAEGAGRLTEMEKALRRVMELAPASHHAYNALGYALAEHNLRLLEARDLVAKALELVPEDPFVLDSMGWVNFRMGRLAEAETLLRRAWERQPDPEIGSHLGEVLWRRGKGAEAQAAWRAVRAQDPNNAALRGTLARLNVKLK